MHTTNIHCWLSCYLYYSHTPEALLTDIKRLVDVLREDKLARQFFFIRYGDRRGPHVRLRIKARTEDASALRLRITHAFPAAEFVAYVPETKRYGGPHGVTIAEQLFEASSVAALHTITAHKTFHYSQALAAAAQMHIGMRGPEFVKLCGHVAAHYHQKDPAKIAIFKRQLDAQRTAVAPQLTALWKTCEHNTRFTDKWFSDWRQQSAAVGRQLASAQAKHQLDLREHHRPRASKLWHLYESYIHMTNNRLGLSRVDESFIAYLLQQSLKENYGS